MQRQEINLFKSFATSRPAANFLTWPRLLLAYSFVILLFFGIYLYSSAYLYFLTKEKNAVTIKAKQFEKEFLALKQSYPALFFNSNVGLSMEAMQKELLEQKQLLKSLQIADTFSHYLIAFSTEIVSNVWLTNIQFNNSGDAITLKGKSNNMDTLQLFITHLTANKLFSDYVFNLDNIQKNETADDSSFLLFELSMRKSSL